MKKFVSLMLCVAVASHLMLNVVAGDEIIGNGDASTDILIEENNDSSAGLPPSDWASEAVSWAGHREVGVIPQIFSHKWTKPVTREQFCILAYNTYKLTAKPFEEKIENVSVYDCDSDAVLALVKAEIVEGREGVEVDGIKRIIFNPDDTITREEAAKILHKMCIALDIDDVYDTYMLSSYMFLDEDEFSAWAKEHIYNVQLHGIMQGVGNDKFLPKGEYTLEQSIVTLKRIYDKCSIVNVNKSEVGEKSFADSINFDMPEDKNYMFSPFSVKMLLAMSANGAVGETKEEILKALNISDLDEFNQKARSLIDTYSKSEILKLNIANSLWLNESRSTNKFSDDFLEIAKKYYDASADTVNNEIAVEKINSWVKDKTNGKIPSIIDNNDFWSYLVNAVYFKARWQNEFNKNATEKDVFYERSGEEKETDFMNDTSWYSYSDKNGVQIIELPYKNAETVQNENGEMDFVRHNDIDVSMYLIKSDAFYDAEYVLNNAEFERSYIRFTMPKFEIEYEENFNQILMDAGIRRAFYYSAQFDKMYQPGSVDTMWITDVTHKTYIKVDEEGTEAAAVTGMGMAGSSLPPEPIEVKYNSPFTFIVKDNISGEILFMGEYAFVK